jgi:uncharacterized protein (TIGR00297 family)
MAQVKAGVFRMAANTGLDLAVLLRAALTALLLALGSLSLFFAAHFLGRRNWVRAEQARKLVHLIGSCVAAWLPWIATRDVLIPASLLLAVLLRAVDRRGWIGGLGTRERPIRGAFWFLVAYVILLALDWDRVSLSAAFVALGVSDTFAALVGGRWGRQQIGIGFHRTWFGTLAFFLSALVVLGAFAAWIGLPPIVGLALACSIALTAAATEALAPSEFDNLLIPLCVALLFRAERGWEADRALLHLGEIAFSVAFVALARRKSWLTGDGALAVLLFGLITFACAQWQAVFVLFVCLAVLIVLTRLRPDRVVQEDHRGRRARQIAAFAVIPAAAAVLYGLTGAPGFLALVGVVAATAAADGWATEVGRLSTRAPLLITSRAVVEPGTSGGVTGLGLLASCGGALLTSTLAAVVGLYPASQVGLVAAVGTAGGLADSLLGATAQASYRCASCGSAGETRPTCHPADVRITKGIRWVDNEAVNFLASAFACCLYVAMAPGILH